MCIESLLLGALFNTIFATCLMSLLLGALFNTKLLLQNFILDHHSYYTIKCLKHVSYCVIESSKRICKYALTTPLLAQVFVKRNVHKKGVVAVHFLLQSQLSGRYRRIYLQDFDIRQKTTPLKHDRSRSNISAGHHQSCLPCRYVAIYFAQITQPFFALLL